MSLKGKTCLITGSTSGIGKETALGMARMEATLILVARDPDRGRRVLSEIVDRTGNSDITVLNADLSSLESVRLLAQEVRKRCPKLHVLVNNAGGIHYRRSMSADGLEITFATNHLAYFLLTNLLLDLLIISAPARIINVSSQVHFSGHIDFDDLQEENHYDAFRAYCNSKLANVLFTYELARRLAGTRVAVNCLHPGVVATNFGRGSGLLGTTITIASPFMLTPEEGSQTSIYLASSPEVGGVSGKYFVKCSQARSSPESYDENVALSLWKISASLTGLADAEAT